MVSIDRYLPILSSFGPGTAAAAEWTPARLALLEWQKADAGIVAGDGTQFSPWSDQSGNARDQGQNTGTQQPVYVANGINGMPCVRYSSAASEVTESNLPGNTPSAIAEFAIAWVWRPNLILPSSLGFWAWSTGIGSGSPYCQCKSAGSAAIQIFTGTNQFSAFDQTHLAVNAWVLNFDGNTYSVYKDGTLQQQVSGSGAFPVVNLLLLGNAAQGFGTVDYAEFIVFKHVLQTADLTNLSTYFRKRWGTP